MAYNMETYFQVSNPSIEEQYLWLADILASHPTLSLLGKDVCKIIAEYTKSDHLKDWLDSERYLTVPLAFTKKIQVMVQVFEKHWKPVGAPYNSTLELTGRKALDALTQIGILKRNVSLPSTDKDITLL